MVERLDGLDVSRGMAVAMVVLLHATLLPQALVQLPQPVCRMALLLLISGAVAAPGATRPWMHSAIRACDLLWLLVIWTPITLLVQRGPSGLWSTGWELIAPGTHLWYIAGLAALTLTVPVSRLVHPAIPLSVSCMGMLWYLAGGRTGVHGYDQMLHFSVFFFMGFHGRDRLFALLRRCGRREGVAAFGALLAMTILPFPHTAVTMGSAAALLLVAQGLASTPAGAALAWFGRRTPDVYLVHVPVLLVVGRAIGPIDGGTLALLVIGTIAACLALRTLADRAGLGWLYRRPRIGSPMLHRRLGDIRAAVPFHPVERIAR